MNITDFLNSLSQLVRSSPSVKCIIAGDVNAKHPLWGGSMCDDRGLELLNFIDDNGFEVVNTASFPPPTFNCNRGVSWIDVTLTRGIGDSLREWTVEDQITGSDHCLISFSLLSSLPPPVKTRSYDVHRVRNWLGVKHRIYRSFDGISLADLPGTTLDSQVAALSKRVVDCFPHQNGSCPANRAVGRGSPWWTSALAVQRSRVRALRRRFQHESDVAARAQCRMVYGKALAKFKKAIIKAKRHSWNGFLDRISVSDPLRSWDYLITDSVDSNLRHKIVHPVHGVSDGVASSIKFLLDYHFPTVVDPLPALTGLSYSVPPITYGELELCLSESRRNSAPGPDGIALSVWEEIFGINPCLILDLFNSCLVNGIFPASWLVARVVFFEKFGKDPSRPSSYRPICLLDSLGKLLERVVAGRMNFYLSENGLLSSAQFGFVRGSSTVRAIDRVCGFIGESRPDLHVSLFALDVKNAFNSLRWSLVLGDLMRLNVPGYLIRIIKAYFGNRRVSSEYVDDFELSYNVGAPQGSILAPLLWNIALNSLLELNFDEDVDVIAYADDILVMVRGASTPNVAIRANATLDRISSWCDTRFLILDNEKSCQMFFPKSGISASSPPRVFLNGLTLRRSYNLKYLGVNFDTNLSWTFHLNSLYSKTQVVYHRLLRISSKTWGLSPAVRKKLYLTKIVPMILYGSQVWWRWGRGARMNSLLDKIQRPFLLLITRSFRTVSTAALQVMAGVPPLYYIAEQRSAIYGLSLGYDISYGLVEIEATQVEHPIGRHYLNPLAITSLSWSMYDHHCTDLQIFTDGSRMDNRVGAGFVAYLLNGSSPIYAHHYRLSDHASVFQAEVLAILRAVEWVSPLNIDRVSVISDSRSALDAICSSYSSTDLVYDTHTRLCSLRNRIKLFWTRSHVGTTGNEAADSMAKSATHLSSVDFDIGISISRIKHLLSSEMMNRWNAAWHCDTAGRPVFDIWPRVGLSIRVGDFYLAQLATNHGTFPVYFNRFWNRGNSCQCGVLDADRSHYIYDCPLLDNLRRNFLPSLARSRPTLNTLFSSRSTSRGLAALMLYVVSHEDSIIV